MVLLLTLLLLPLVCLSKPPLEYILLKRYLETRDIYTAYYLLSNFRGSVFEDELRVELAWDLLKAGRGEEALKVIKGVDLGRVRDIYADKLTRIWSYLRLDPKPIAVRFPERFPDLLGSLNLTEEERREVLNRLLTKGRYETVLKLAGDLCLYRTVALYRLGRLREVARVAQRCDDKRAWRYGLVSLIKTSGIEEAKRFALKKKDPDLYFLLGWELLMRGDLKGARRYIARSGENLRRYFYLALIRYMEGRYRIAYEILSEAEELAKGSMEKARIYFWKFKVLMEIGDKVMAYYYLSRATGEEGFYGAVARKMIGERVYRRPVLRVADGGDPATLSRLMGIAEAGFPYYLRLEILRKRDTLSPWDLLEISRIDPHTAVVIAARRFGVGSDVYRYLAFPTPYRAIVRRASERFGVEDALIYAVMRQESLFDPFVVSRSDAKGLMQLIDKTAEWVGRRFGINSENLFNPETNILLGTAYLKFLMDLWEGDLVRVLASYNAGHGVVSRWKRYEDDFLYIELIPYRETRKYVKRVLWFYYVYREVLSEGGS